MRKDNQIIISGTVETIEQKFSQEGKLRVEAAVGVIVKDWSKNETYTKFPFKAFGNQAEPFSSLKVGDAVRCLLSIEPKEYNGRSYINATLDNFERLEQQKQPSIDADIPF